MMDSQFWKSGANANVPGGVSDASKDPADARVPGQVPRI